MLFVIATGVASIVVGFTGFCIVGNVLLRLGLKPKLGDEAAGRGKFYFMQTDSWYLERRIYVAVGINISIASVLSLVHSPWWLAFTGFVGVAMVWFAATGFCIMANALYWMGAEPRLAPGVRWHDATSPARPPEARRPLLGENPELERELHVVRAVREPELLSDPLLVRIDGLGTDEQFLADLRRGKALRDVA